MIKEVEVDLDLDDITEYIDNASKDQIKVIRDHVSIDEDNEDADYTFKVDNLYTREKVMILKTAFKKYNLEQLVEKLGGI